MPYSGGEMGQPLQQTQQSTHLCQQPVLSLSTTSNLVMQGYIKQSFWMHFLPSCLSSLLLLLLVSILMEKYYKVCVARAAVNVSVCEESTH